MPAMLFPDGPSKQKHRGHGPLLQGHLSGRGRPVGASPTMFHIHSVHCGHRGMRGNA